MNPIGNKPRDQNFDPFFAASEYSSDLDKELSFDSSDKLGGMEKSSRNLVRGRPSNTTSAVAKTI